MAARRQDPRAAGKERSELRRQLEDESVEQLDAVMTLSPGDLALLGQLWASIKSGVGIKAAHAAAKAAMGGKLGEALAEFRKIAGPAPSIPSNYKLPPDYKGLAPKTAREASGHRLAAGDAPVTTGKKLRGWSEKSDSERAGSTHRGLRAPTEANFESGTPIDAPVREIERETQQLRLAGKLKPFVEGEPIGTLPKKAPVKNVSSEEMAAAANKVKEGKRSAMLEHRARNDAAMNKIMNSSLKPKSPKKTSSGHPHGRLDSWPRQRASEKGAADGHENPRTGVSGRV